MIQGKGRRYIPSGRLEALSDGIFAVAMTILVLDLKAPPYRGSQGIDVFSGYIQTLPDPLLNFVISFLLISMFWIGHHRQFSEIRITDTLLQFINLSLLAVIALIPFTTSLMSSFIDLWEADIFFHFNILIAGALMTANWSYATKDLRLVDKNIDPETVTLGMRRSILIPIIALAGMGTSFFLKGDSAIVYLLLPLFSSLIVITRVSNNKTGRDQGGFPYRS